MANSFATMQAIAREAMPRLIDNLVFPNLIYRDYSAAVEASKGDAIQIRKPVVFAAQDFDPATGVQVQDINEGSVLVTLDKIATVDVEASAVEAATSIDDLNRIFIEPAAAALAEKINADGLKLYADIANYVTADVDAPVQALIMARMQLNKSKAPVGDRCAVLHPEYEAALCTDPAILNAEKSGDTKALKEGSIGRVMGFDNYMSQGVQEHDTAITAATGLKVAAAVTAGATKLNISGTTLTGHFVKGDLFTIAGKCYVVTADSGNASSNAISNVQVYPALPALSANDGITFASSGVCGLAFHPSAFAFVSRPMYNPDGEGVNSYVTNYNGLSLRVTKGYNQQYKKSMYSMDVLYGFKTVHPELACRIVC